MLLTSLSPKQQSAVLSEARRVLVLAGAGSGKTKTVITKIQHLVKDKMVKPSGILAITFTKNATNEMVDRLIAENDESGSYAEFLESKLVTAEERDAERRKKLAETPWLSKLTIRTMHSLCYTILKSHGNPVFDNKFRLITDESGLALEGWKKLSVAPERAYDILHKLLIFECKDRSYLLNFKRYILDYFVDRFAIERQIHAMRNPSQKTYTTLKGEKVKSKSERDIADWLFRHNVLYKYEAEVNVKDFDFRPDFYVPQANLFIEHNSNLSYAMGDKEKQFREGERLYVKTHEGMMNDSNLFNLAMERIVLGRITDRLDEDTGLNYEEEFRSYQDKVKEFLKLTLRLLSMIKTEDANPDQLLEKANMNEHERVRNFYQLAVPLINSYQEYCANKSYIDFEDLIILTIKLLKEHPEVREIYQKKFRYVMVDEFQDVNSLQVRLLDELLSPDAQLFCVGDDWQAIYGFRGSNVDYIVNFEKHYPGSEVHKLDINYRSTQSIVGASNEVIRHNKNQVPKDVSAHKQSPSHIEIYRAQRPGDDDLRFFADKVKELNAKGYGKDDILVLYRRSKMGTPFFDAIKGRHAYATFRTIHASKGLEAKAVFIVGLSEGSDGFPDVWLDDAIFRVVKDVKIDTLLEEERRLFYVAITRAKDELFLITELGNESQFIEEIPLAFFSKRQTGMAGDARPRVCPACGTKLIGEKNFCGECGGRIK